MEILPVIRYISGGLLGDFIHNLSIVNENYLKSGRKGIIYLRNTPVYFRLGLDRAFLDTYPFISLQPYVDDYKIHDGEPYDIDLDTWRGSHLLYNTNLYTIYKNTYDVEWATHPWLHISTVNPTFINTVFICCSIHRYPHTNFQELFEKHGINIETVQFMTQGMNEYEFFKERSGLDIPLYMPATLEDMVVAINSCALFIGNMSSPLTYAYALHKKNITLHNFHDWGGDDVFFRGLETVVPNITFSP